MMTRMERAVLAKLCKTTGTSKAAHVPEHTFVKKFDDARAARKALKKLVAAGYVAMHPTRSEMTYQMTDAGWEICRELKKKAP